MKKFFYLVLVFLLSACGHGAMPSSDPSGNNDSGTNAITSFSLNNTVGVIDGDNINIIMPYGTNISSLIATYTTTGQEVTVNGVIQENKITSNDFTNPVTYMVKAQNGSIHNYLVVVTTASISAKEITDFSLNGTQGVINGDNIYVTMPYGTDLSSLTASYITTGVSVTVNNTTQINSQSTNSFINPVIYTVHAADGSTKDYTISVVVASTSAKEITWFALNGTQGTIIGNNIGIIMPTGTDINSLTASYITTGISVTVGSIVQVSGQTLNDYTNPVIYTIHAADGSIQNYTITVVVASNTAKDILSFSLNGTSGVIIGNNINVTMPVGHDVKSLTASYITTGVSVRVNNIVQVSGQTLNDYTNPVIYTVYAEDGTTQNYTVTVTVAVSSAKDILSFSLNGTSGVIIGNNINVQLPYGSDVSSLTASYITTGVSVSVNNIVQVSDQTSNNFTNPVIYTVHAADGSTQNYTVLVVVANSSAKQATSFWLDGIQGVIMGRNISVTLPYGSDVSSLIASYITTGVSVRVNGVIQMNGVTSNNFMTPTIYTVYAADGTTEDYIVSVAVANVSAKQITSFWLNGVQGVINGNNINVAIPYDSDINTSTASYITTGVSVSVNGVEQINGLTSNNFANPVVYTVRAQNGTTEDYQIRVTQSSSKEIVSFSIDGVAGKISNNNILIMLPYKTNVKSLVANYVITGVSIQINGVEQISGLTPNNFTNPVTYVVQAKDGTLRSYIVKVELETSAINEITKFSLNGSLGVIQGNSIFVTMPYNTNVKSLIATYVTTGASVRVNGVEQINKVTSNNFTNPVTYVVTAEDGTTQEYVVNVVNSGKYVAIDGLSGVIVTSSDGVNWESPIITSETFYNYNLQRVIVSNSEQYIILGTASAMGHGEEIPIVVISNDGVNWRAVGAGGFYGRGGAVCNTTGQFVAVGNDGYIVTVSGANWNMQKASSSSYLSAAAASNNGIFVAVGTGGKIVKSENGTSWTNATSNTTESLLSVTVSNGTGRFVAVGVRRTILTSLNGSTWAVVSSPLDSKVKLTAVTVNRSGRYVAVGDNNTIITSVDGVNWTASSPPPTMPFDTEYVSVTVSKAGEFTVVNSNNSNIIRSYDGINWSILSTLPNASTSWTGIAVWN